MGCLRLTSRRGQGNGERPSAIARSNVARRARGPGQVGWASALGKWAGPASSAPASHAAANRGMPAAFGRCPCVGGAAGLERSWLKISPRTFESIESNRAALSCRCDSALCALQLQKRPPMSIRRRDGARSAETDPRHLQRRLKAPRAAGFAIPPPLSVSGSALWAFPRMKPEAACAVGAVGMLGRREGTAARLTRGHGSTADGGAHSGRRALGTARECVRDVRVRGQGSGSGSLSHARCSASRHADHSKTHRHTRP